MKQAISVICCMLFVSISLSAQDTLDPVRGNLTGLDTMHVEVDRYEKDHSRFVAEKTFQFKLLVEYPTKDEAGFLPDWEAHVGMLWIRLENLSKYPLQVNTAKFSLTDEEGHTLPLLSPDEAF